MATFVHKSRRLWRYSARICSARTDAARSIYEDDITAAP
jgi:hypothetical protein